MQTLFFQVNNQDQDILRSHFKMPNTNQSKFDPSEDYPDLSKHNNWMAKCLTPEIYANLRDKHTPNGVTLDQV